MWKDVEDDCYTRKFKVPLKDLNKNVIVQAIPATRRESPSVCETSRLPHFLHNRFTGSGKVVSFTRRPPFTPKEDSWYSFLLEAELPPGPFF
jgi:hypothetical protein